MMNTTEPPASDVRLLREDKVWHVWVDGEHVCECCDFTFHAAVDRLKVAGKSGKVRIHDSRGEWKAPNDPSSATPDQR